MKLLLIGIGIGVGLCIFAGSRIFDNLDLSLAPEVEDDGFITCYSSPPINRL